MSQLNNEENITEAEDILKKEEINQELDKKVENEKKSSNENKWKIKKEKKKLTTRKKIIIFLSIFLIIAVSLTFVAVLYTNKNIKNNIIEITKKEKSKDNIEGIKSLTEKYNSNDLKIISKEFKKGDLIETEYDNYYKLEINYVQIEGLKDKKLEEKINQEIKDNTFNMYTEEELESKEVKNININAVCNANYANILSISIYKNTEINSKKYEYKYENMGLNFNLKTGEKLDFNDLFVSGTNIKNIITKSAYKDLALQYLSNSEESDGYNDMDKVNYAEVENDIFLILNAYNAGNFTFSFSEEFIYLNANNKSINIKMSDYYKDIAIYNRYKDNNDIYDGTYTGQKNLFVFMYWDQKNNYYNVFEEVSENLFVDVKIYIEEETLKNSIVKKLANQYKTEIEEQIENYKQEAKNQPNKAIIYETYITLYYQPDNDIISIEQYSGEYKMSKAYYDSDFYNYIATSNRAKLSESGVMWGQKYYTYPKDQSDIIKDTHEDTEYGSISYLEIKNIKQKQEYINKEYDIKGNLIIPDTIAPEITLNGSEFVTIQINEPYIELGAKAIDDKDGDITGNIYISGYVNSYIEGTYEITYSVIDSSKNSTTVTRKVKVENTLVNENNMLNILNSINVTPNGI